MDVRSGFEFGKIEASNLILQEEFFLSYQQDSVNFFISSKWINLCSRWKRNIFRVSDGSEKEDDVYCDVNCKLY